jgi:hypothetical protein
MELSLADLKKDVLDSSVPMVDLLRKALVVAQQHKANEIEKWIRLEINGYTEPELTIAPYRDLKGTPKARNPIRGLIPVQAPPEDLEILQKVFFIEPIGWIEKIEKDDAKSSNVYIPIPDWLQSKCDQLSARPYKIFIHINPVKLSNILETVRNKLLDWIFYLESLEISRKPSRTNNEGSPKITPKDRERYEAAENYLSVRIEEGQRLKKDPKLNLKMTEEYYRATLKGIDYCFKPELAEHFLRQFMNGPKEAQNKYADLNFVPMLTYYQDIIKAWMEQLTPDWFRDEFKDVDLLEILAHGRRIQKPSRIKNVSDIKRTKLQKKPKRKNKKSYSLKIDSETIKFKGSGIVLYRGKEIILSPSQEKYLRALLEEWKINDYKPFSFRPEAIKGFDGDFKRNTPGRLFKDHSLWVQGVIGHRKGAKGLYEFKP